MGDQIKTTQGEPLKSKSRVVLNLPKNDKPWRSNMRRETSKEKANVKNGEEIKTKTAERPWRVNMRKKTEESKTVKQDEEKGNEREADPRPWRNNMRKEKR